MSAVSFAVGLAATFNLVCTGTQYRQEKGQDATRTPFTSIIRVDLTAHRFCFDECRNSLPITSEAADQIVFQNTEGAEGAFKVVQRVSRENGDYYFSVEIGSLFLGRSGTCKPAPFTGLPKQQF